MNGYFYHLFSVRKKIHDENLDKSINIKVYFPIGTFFPIDDRGKMCSISISKFNLCDHDDDDTIANEVITCIRASVNPIFIANSSLWMKTLTNRRDK